MSTYFVQGSTMDAIADAINQKAGTQAAMTPAQMVTAIGNIPSGGSGSLQITIASTITKISDFLALLPSGHESEGFTATALNKPSSGYYTASISGPVNPGNAYLAIMRSSDGQTPATATTGQAWSTFQFQAGITYEVIFYEL